PLLLARAEALSKAGFRKKAALAFEEASGSADTREMRLRAAQEHIAAGDFQQGLKHFSDLLTPYKLQLHRPYAPRLMMLSWWMFVMILCWGIFDLRELMHRSKKRLPPDAEQDFQLRLFMAIHESMFVFDP